MARVFDMVSIALNHAAEFGCETVSEWIPLTSERTCWRLESSDPAVREQCYDQHQHARTCDECGADMLLTRSACEHVSVSTHTCSEHPRSTKRYSRYLSDYRGVPAMPDEDDGEMMLDEEE